MNPARVLAAGFLWRLFGNRQSAETLLDAVAGDDEQNRMLAGISLVRAGDRSFDLIEEKLSLGKGNAEVIRLLPDIDERRARRVLGDEVTRGGELANTARECLDTLDRIEAFDDTQH